MSAFREFDWLEDGATPELADLGKRLAACIRKHGYSEHDWLVGCMKRQVARLGFGALTLRVEEGADGKWVSAWKPAARPAPSDMRAAS